MGVFEDRACHQQDKKTTMTTPPPRNRDFYRIRFTCPLTALPSPFLPHLTTLWVSFVANFDLQAGIPWPAVATNPCAPMSRPAMPACHESDVKLPREISPHFPGRGQEGRSSLEVRLFRREAPATGPTTNAYLNTRLRPAAPPGPRRRVLDGFYPGVVSSSETVHVPFAAVGISMIRIALQPPKDGSRRSLRLVEANRFLSCISISV
ncbi:hypothetical protein B0H65DRAFT_446906 [Neurospora tetraspora]|uniref:Uncharacterized protein n=1 Tax=Neurospora tetraspora TaxID=94610 RepID=A0AAE0J0X1_9PEZI|nr:hypothetical protein B0H65DRAFT_446906 [Neurospora tetraspora]